MEHIFTQENGLSFELNQQSLTAKIINSPQAKEDIFIPRSINYQSQEYLIIRIEENSFKNNRKINSISFSKDSEMRSIGSRAFCYSTIRILYIPSKIEALEDGWCSCTKSLIHVYLSSNNKNYKYLDIEGKIIVGKSNQKCDEFDVLIFASRDVEKVTIPTTIKQISPHSFEECCIVSFVFEEESNVESIGSYAFNNCQLKQIAIPSSVKQLKDGWLGQRWSPIEVTISPGNKFYKYINNSIIVGKSDLNSDEFDVVVYALFEIQKAIIPSSIKYIDSFAFFNCQILEKVEFQSDSNLISIGESAFCWTIIDSIIIPKSYKLIKKSAFDSCRKLTSVHFHPDSKLVSIPSKMFNDASINSLTIPKNIQKFDKGWCKGTDYLENVIISPDNKNFSYLDDDHKIVVGKSSPNNVGFDVIIFAGRGIEQVFIPSEIKYIDSYAFYFCKKLKKIIFSNDIQLISIGKKAFAGLKIQSIDIPSSLNSISSGCFFQCKNLKTINIPENSQLESIEDYAFDRLKINELYLPPKLKYFSFQINDKIKIKISKSNNNFKFIDEDEKIICGKSDQKSDVFDTILFVIYDIKKAYIPSYIKYIKEKAFSICYQLNELKFDNDSQLTSIESYAFQNINIHEIKIPSSVKYIGECCFYLCSNLNRVEFENNSQLTVFNNSLFDSSNIEYLSFPSSLKEIRDECFSATPMLNHIYLPPKNKNFAYIDEEHKMIGAKSDQKNGIFDTLVFARRDIRDVSIPTTITKISMYAFCDCTKIYKLFIPKNVTEIDDFAFYNCTNMSSIEFEEKSLIKSLGYHSFGYSLIEHFTVPESNEKINLDTFLSCKYLKSIEFLGVDLIVTGFLSSDSILVISFPNANRICANYDSFSAFSSSFTLFVQSTSNTSFY